MTPVTTLENDGLGNGIRFTREPARLSFPKPLLLSAAGREISHSL